MTFYYCIVGHFCIFTTLNMDLFFVFFYLKHPQLRKAILCMYYVCFQCM